jgi:DNA-binding NarL/FixJ family response regulator
MTTTDIYTPELRAQTTHEELGKNIEALLYKITNLKGEVEILREANTILHSRLDTARRSFGEAFIKGDVTKGPNRPNRQKLTEREVKDIRQAFRGGMRQKDLARNYGVNPATISRTVRGIYH